MVCVDGNLGERLKASSDEGEISTGSAKFFSDDVIGSPHLVDD